MAFMSGSYLSTTRGINVSLNMRGVTTHIVERESFLMILIAIANLVLRVWEMRMARRLCCRVFLCANLNP